MSLVTTEMSRALRRRAIRALVAIAASGCAFAGIVAWYASAGRTVSELRLDDEGNPAIMTDWWIAESHEGFLTVAMFFLFLGGFVGGATVAGGEWRAGTVTTVLTWEPRRLRVHGARSVSAAILAFGLSFVLQMLFLASFLPAVLAHGTADGADASFWVGLAVVMVRTSILTAAASVLAIALATIGRNTAFAVIVMFAWLVVVEGLIRALWPSSARWLWSENLGTIMTGARLDDAGFERGPAVAALTLFVYCAVIVAAAAASFRRRDVASSS